MGKYLFGLLLITLGVLYLLNNSGYIDFSIGELITTYWPLIIIYFGAKIVLKTGFRMLVSVLKGKSYYYSFSSLFWGLLLLAIGVVILGNNLDLFTITVRDFWNWLWPIIIIYIGILLLRGKSYYKFDINDETDRAEWTSSNKRLRKRQLIGDVNLGKSTWELEDLDLWLGVGDVDVDLSRAIIPEGETYIEIKGWVGDINVRLPQHTPVKVAVDIRVGEADVLNHNQSGIVRSPLTYKSDNYDAATHKINLYISLSVGDVTVQRVD